MEAGKILMAEAPHAADDQGQGVAQGEHRRGAGAGREAERTGLLQRSQVDHGVAARPSVLVRGP